MTLDEQIKCVEREIDKRKRFYPRWVAEGRMKQIDADYEIECMQYVLNTIKQTKQYYISLITRYDERLKK